MKQVWQCGYLSEWERTQSMLFRPLSVDSISMLGLRWVRRKSIAWGSDLLSEDPRNASSAVGLGINEGLDDVDWPDWLTASQVE